MQSSLVMSVCGNSSEVRRDKWGYLSEQNVVQEVVVRVACAEK